jgi:hypothetical protein
METYEVVIDRVIEVTESTTVEIIAESLDDAKHKAYDLVTLWGVELTSIAPAHRWNEIHRNVLPCEIQSVEKKGE